MPLATPGKAVDLGVALEDLEGLQVGRPRRGHDAVEVDHRQRDRVERAVHGDRRRHAEPAEPAAVHRSRSCWPAVPGRPRRRRSRPPVGAREDRPVGDGEPAVGREHAPRRPGRGSRPTRSRGRRATLDRKLHLPVGGQHEALRARPAVADVEQRPGGGVAGVVADVDALAGRARARSAIESAEAFASAPAGFSCVILTVPLPCSRARARRPSCRAGWWRRRRRASAVESPAPPAGSWKIETVWAMPEFWMRTACCGFAALSWFTTSSRPSASAPRFE